MTCALSIDISKTRQLLDEKLDTLFKADTPLFVSSRYALKEGKRLRPLLLLTAALSYGVSIEKALEPACAWELVHTYSLIHDDLPCMDDDDERRGRRALHRAFEEWHAVLTGDFLLTYAFELISCAPHLQDSIKLKLITLLARSSGSEGMIGGQMLDLSLNPSDTNWQLLKRLHLKKTGALFSSALEAGAILSSAPTQDCLLLKELGELLGLRYQLSDDLTDGESERPSAISTLGKTETKILIDEIQETIQAKLKALTIDASPLNMFINIIVKKQTPR